MGATKHIRTWYRLRKRLDKREWYQLNHNILIKVDDKYYNGQLVFTHNGSCYHFELVKDDLYVRNKQDWSDESAEMEYG